MMMVAFCNSLSVVLKLIEEVFDETNSFKQSYILVIFLRVQSYLELYLTAMADFLVVEVALCRVMAFYITNSDKWTGRKCSLVIAAILWISVGIISSAVIPMMTIEKSNIENSFRMLKVVLIMFLLVKTPQAMLVIFNSLFLLDYYLLIAPLSTEILKALDSANASASFIIYCVISSQFRNVFVRIFVPGGIQRRIHSARTIQVTAVKSTGKATWS
ncbi:hypothetical protein CRE_27279 [Caenorhabditis remanei]|uniref:G-protein coupled receptors family 1 profile domain-containing protein n=1 Tax=Caenorhabditis remanei TaxID=31234 RepID=E3LPF7_CAERE|nr:hypothetical protein CRE_27279 [Caenorhabditis remanei]